mmetsp:Transcript_16353/g.42241  ORF Transcript_16353/g.42241 Transcript_16353/m.42241 type:complete len:305 (+) Transcript_16353:501-1415(+)
MHRARVTSALRLKRRHGRWLLLAVERRIPGVQRIQTPPRRAFDALAECAHLRPGNVVGVVEGHHRTHLRRVVDVVRHGADPALRHGPGDVLTHQAELRLAVVPLELPRLGAMHLAVRLGHRMCVARPQEVLLGVPRVQRGGSQGRGDVVDRLQGVGAPRIRLLGTHDVRDVERPVLARASGPRALRALVVVRARVLDVARVVGVPLVVPVWVEHPRLGVFDVRDVVRVPTVEARRRLRPLEGGRERVVRAHGVGVAVPLPTHVLWLRVLDVSRRQAEVARPAVHRHVVGARTASSMLRVGAAHG